MQLMLQIIQCLSYILVIIFEKRGEIIIDPVVQEPRVGRAVFKVNSALDLESFLVLFIDSLNFFVDHFLGIVDFRELHVFQEIPDIQQNL